MTYVFDNSFEGLLTCVFDCFDRKDKNVQLANSHEFQPSLLSPYYIIESDQAKSKRVFEGLKKKVGVAVANDFYRCYLSEDPKAWQAAFAIMCGIFEGNTSLLKNFGNDDVLYFSQTLKKVSRERHRMKAFIRFQKASDGLYFALIEPDFNVLPLILSFFKNRYTDQNWLIYDVKRKYGCLYNQTSITEVHLTAKEKNALQTATTEITIDEQESLYQKLWQQYFKSTNIEARKNIKLHLQHVPKRYWKYLIEKQ